MAITILFVFTSAHGSGICTLMASVADGTTYGYTCELANAYIDNKLGIGTHSSRHSLYSGSKLLKSGRFLKVVLQYTKQW